MFRIVAAVYRDGWAFVQQGDRTLLVRPPYRKAVRLSGELRLRDPVEVPPGAVQQAVESYGFQPQNEEAVDLGAVVALLEQRRLQIADQEGAPSLNDQDRVRRLIRSAPCSVLERYLDRTESELLPRGEVDAALRVLAAMSHGDIEHADAAIRERVSRLIALCSEQLSWRQALVDHTAASRWSDPAVEARLSRKFPYLARCGSVAAVRAYEERRAVAGGIFPL